MAVIGKFYGLGTGPGDPGLLTLKAADILRNVDCIFEVVGANSRTSVSGSVINSLECTGKRIQLTFSMSLDKQVRQQQILDNAKQVAVELEQGHDCAFATIGDPSVFSTYSYLLKDLQQLIPGLEVETIPGVTAFQAAAAIANIPLVEDKESMCVIPAFSEIDKYPLDAVDTLVFLKTYHSRNAIVETLRQKGWDGCCIYAAHIGLADQFVTTDLSDLEERPDEYLSLLIVKKF